MGRDGRSGGRDRRGEVDRVRRRRGRQERRGRGGGRRVARWSRWVRPCCRHGGLAGGSGCQVGGGGRLVVVEEEGDAGEGPEVGGLVVGRQLPLPLVAAILEPDFYLKQVMC